MGNMGGCCGQIGGLASGAGDYIGNNAGEAGESLLDRVQTKLGDKMDEVLNEKLAERCGDQFDRAVDQLVDKTFEMTFDKAFGAIDNALDDMDGKEEEEKKRQQEIKDTATKKLKKWKMEKSLIIKLDVNGYLDESKWGELRDDPDILRDELGFNDQQVQYFLNCIDPKTKKEIAIDKLKDWGIPQSLISNMDNEGWLDERNWDVLTKNQLKSMGFGDGHIVLFMNGMSEIKQKKFASTQTLKNWGIPQSLINNMNKEGYLDEDRWIELKNDPKKLKNMSFAYKYIESFLDEMENRENEEPYQILKKWKIGTESIKKLAAKRQLDESHWHELKKKDLENMTETAPRKKKQIRLVPIEQKGDNDDEVKFEEIEEEIEETVEVCWTKDEIDTFLTKRDERIAAKQKSRKPRTKRGAQHETDPSEILREWGIPSDLINRLKESGWGHPEYWDDLLDQEYELEDIGFRNGHISTFKRKFQVWKEIQDSQRTERKIQLLRKLDKSDKKQSSILKRNIDVENDTDELIKVRIIGERKYDSFKSSSAANAEHESKQTQRSNEEASSSNIKSSKQATSDSTNEQNKTLAVKVGANAVIPTAGMSTVGVDVGVNKTQNDKSTKSSTSASEDTRDTASRTNKQRRNQMAKGAETSQSEQSQHQWDKVEVGFTEIMPKQTIVFPVQISDPNSVVYMTIKVPSTQERICENVQIDANFIQIEEVKYGKGTKIKWKHDVKPPKDPKFSKVNRHVIERGIITADGLCEFMNNKGVDEWVRTAIRRKLKGSRYDVTKNEDVDSLHRHVYNAITVAIQLNGYDIGYNQHKYSKIKTIDFEDETKTDIVTIDDSNKSGTLGSDKLIDDKEYVIRVNNNSYLRTKKDGSIQFVEADEKLDDQTATRFKLMYQAAGDQDKDTTYCWKVQRKQGFKVTFWDIFNEFNNTFPGSELILDSVKLYGEGGSQLFQFENVKDDDYRIRVKHTKKCLYYDAEKDRIVQSGEDESKSNGAEYLFNIKEYKFKPKPKFNANQLLSGLKGLNKSQKQKKYGKKAEEAQSEQETEEETEEKNQRMKGTDRMTDNDRVQQLIKHYVMTNSDVIKSRPTTGWESFSIENKEENKGKYVELDTDKLCQYVRNQRVVSDKKIDFIQDTLDGAQYIISEEPGRTALFEKIEKTIVIYDEIESYTEKKEKQSRARKNRDNEKTLSSDITSIVDSYVNVVKDTVFVHHDHDRHIKKYKQLGDYEDYDSDDEELHTVSKFFDVDGYSILQKWKLEQFYERMVDEGWENPLDWIHLDDFIMKQNLGFRPGHIQIFNRKFDLWVKKYNEVRRTIPTKIKGKHGTLIVGPGETKILKSNFNYEFTKVIVRKEGKLTTEAWSPRFPKRGVLFIKSFQEVVLEENASIDVSGKGYWGSKNPQKKGYCPEGTDGGGGSVKNILCGGGGGGHFEKGNPGYTPDQFMYLHLEVDENGDRVTPNHMDNDEDNDEAEDRECAEDLDVYHGERGCKYGNKEIKALEVYYDRDFDEKGNATDEAIKTRFAKAMGSGGGCYYNHLKKKRIRGGTGGGAVKIICDKLIMYENSVIKANGFFDPINQDPLTSGGSGGSVRITANREIEVHNIIGNALNLQFRLEAVGGGKQYDELRYAELIGQHRVGMGGDGRIRIDYHTPYSISFEKFDPKIAYIGEGEDDGTQRKDIKKQESISTVVGDDTAIFETDQCYMFQSVLTDLIFDLEQDVSYDIGLYGVPMDSRTVTIDAIDAEDKIESVNNGDNQDNAEDAAAQSADGADNNDDAIGPIGPPLGPVGPVGPVGPDMADYKAEEDDDEGIVLSKWDSQRNQSWRLKLVSRTATETKFKIQHREEERYYLGFDGDYDGASLLKQKTGGVFLFEPVGTSGDKYRIQVVKTGIEPDYIEEEEEKEMGYFPVGPPVLQCLGVDDLGFIFLTKWTKDDETRNDKLFYIHHFVEEEKSEDDNMSMNMDMNMDMNMNMMPPSNNNADNDDNDGAVMGASLPPNFGDNNSNDNDKHHDVVEEEEEVAAGGGGNIDAMKSAKDENNNQYAVDQKKGDNKSKTEMAMAQHININKGNDDDDGDDETTGLLKK